MLELLNQLDGFDSRGDVKVSLILSSTDYCPLITVHYHDACLVRMIINVIPTINTDYE